MATEKTSTAAAIEAVDAQTRALYRRLRDAGPQHAALAGCLRSLHCTLKDLRVESRDLGSLLNTLSPIYSAESTRQLLPLLDESGTILRQLVADLGRSYNNEYSFSNPRASNSSVIADSHNSDPTYHTRSSAVTAKSTNPLATRSTPSVLIPAEGAGNVNQENSTFVLARRAIEDQTLKFISFYNIVSLRNPPTPRVLLASPPRSPVPETGASISPMPPEDEGLDTIKDRVDAIALRLSQQDLISSSQISPTSIEELWRVFYGELVYEGFSTEALIAHQVNTITVILFHNIFFILFSSIFFLVCFSFFFLFFFP